MKTVGSIFLTLALLLVVEAAKSDVIYNIEINPNSVAALQWNQNVNITFNYKTSQAGGVRIFARPMSGSSLTPAYAASGSPVFTGSGTGSQYFTITSGNAIVDKIRFQVYDANQTQLILEFYVPVKFYFGSHAITNIQVSPLTYASLQHNQNVNITFDYKTTQAGGVRIFPRPMSGSSLAPSYAASGSPLYATGSGSGTGFFSITAGSVNVDGIRFQMYDANQTTLLVEFVVPVKYVFSAHSIASIVVTPSTASGLALNANATVAFSYRTTQAGGVRIFARPFTNNALTPNYAASGSPLYASGSGTGSGTFTITNGSVTVDSIRFQMWDANQTQLLLEWFQPVSFHFATSKITAISFDPSSPAYFTNNERDNMTFSYTNNQTGGVRIFVLPYSGNSWTPNYGVSPSPLYATGSGSGSGFVTILSGAAFVDKIQFKMTNDNQTATYVDWRVPVKFFFGSQRLTDVTIRNIEVPDNFVLSQNYPNPFNPTTTIGFKIQQGGLTTLRVYDILGKEVATLVDENLPAGSYEAVFDASRFASGTYVYRLQSGANIAVRKMALVK
jgi:hypothetical protein